MHAGESKPVLYSALAEDTLPCPERLKASDADGCAVNDITSDSSTEAGSESEGEINVTLGQPLRQSGQQDTLLIFDWDDTLFPTSWLRHKHESSPDTDDQLLAALEARVHCTLQMALTLGRVMIITNAENGWVEYSSMRFMPSLTALLEEVDIVSARTNYEHHDATNPSLWKRLAFMHEIQQSYGGNLNARPNVISLGDSMHEHQALGYATCGMVNCHAKSIKLLELPDLVQLSEEHDLLHESMRGIVEFNGNMDFEISPECVGAVEN